MSFLFSKLFLKLLHHPRLVLGGALIVTLFLGAGINKLTQGTSLLQLFNTESTARQEMERFQQGYGSLNDLVVVAENENPQKLKKFVDSLSQRVLDLPDLFLIENYQDVSYLQENKWLYASVEDLHLFREALRERIHRENLKANPFIEFLTPQEESPAENNLDQLSEKYGRLFFSKPQMPGKTQIIRIYPKNEGTDLRKSSPFIDKIKELAQQIAPQGTQLHFTGTLIKNIEQQTLLARETRQSAILSACLVLFFLLIYFIKQPLIPLIAVIPLSLGLIWSAGFMGWHLGYTNLLCLTLSFLLVGVGSDSIIHLLSRYSEERRKGLGPALSFENIILETGPAITTANLSSAIAFFCLGFFPFKGFQDFGLVAGVGLIFIWINTLLVFPALLLIFQRHRSFPVWGKRIKNHIQFTPRPVKFWKYLGLPLILLIGFMAPSAPTFKSHLTDLDLSPNRGDSLLIAYQQFRPQPLFYQTEDSLKAQKVLRALRQNDRETPELSLSFSMTGSSLVPQNQKAKIHVIEELKALIKQFNPEQIPSDLKEGIQHFLNYQPQKIDEQSLPESLRRIFKTTRQNIPGLVVAFPQLGNSWDVKEAQDIAKLARPLKVDGKTYYPTGVSVLMADYLNRTLPNMNRIFTITLLVVFLLIALDMGSWQYVLLSLIPVAASIPLGLWLMGIVHSPLNPFNLFLIPFLLGYSVDGSLHLVNRYREEGMGSVGFVFKRTGSAVLLATLTSSLGFIGLSFSDHPTLQSLGNLALLALTTSLVASHFILPILLGLIDSTRWAKYRRQET